MLAKMWLLGSSASSNVNRGMRHTRVSTHFVERALARWRYWAANHPQHLYTLPAKEHTIDLDFFFEIFDD